MQAFMPSTPVKSERRRKLRKKPLRLIYVELAFGNGGMMRDLSEEGFAVRAMMSLKPGGTTSFSFMLGDATRIEGEGEILWVEEGGRVAGVQFTQISPEMRAQIDNWLIEDEKTPDPRQAPKEAKIAPAATMEELKEEIRSTPVRAESAAPGLEDNAPVEPQAPPSAPVEPPKVPEPGTAPARLVEPEVEIAAKEYVAPKMGTPEAKKPISPKLVIQPGATPTTSVSEGFFRKWPKGLSSSPAPRSPAHEIPELPLPQEIAAQPLPQGHVVEEVETEERGDAKLSQPDISEILIQPHGRSLHPDAQTHPLPNLPVALRSERTEREWFTLSRALAAMILLTLLVGGYVYRQAIGSELIWIGEAMGGASSHARDASPPDVKGPDSIPTSPSAGAGGDPQPVRPSEGVQPPPSIPSTAAPPPGSASKGAAVSPLSSPGVAGDSGESEYQQAIQLMRGRNSADDSAEAVRLLWIAVEKGNQSAEVSLADMYWHGKGVARNCDQARILFTAAARKGGSEAQKRLQQFRREGCE
jgi:hypothetical protein